MSCECEISWRHETGGLLDTSSFRKILSGERRDRNTSASVNSQHVCHLMRGKSLAVQQYNGIPICSQFEHIYQVRAQNGG